MAVSQGDFWAGNDTRAQDESNLAANWGPTNLDRTHEFTTNWFYQLPTFGGQSAVVRQVLGGWRLGGIFRAQ
jgi:hypothetical protein